MDLHVDGAQFAEAVDRGLAQFEGHEGGVLEQQDVHAALDVQLGVEPIVHRLDEPGLDGIALPPEHSGRKNDQQDQEETNDQKE